MRKPVVSSSMPANASSLVASPESASASEVASVHAPASASTLAPELAPSPAPSSASASTSAPAPASVRAFALVLAVAAAIAVVALAGCTQSSNDQTQSAQEGAAQTAAQSQQAAEEKTYVQISADDAKKMMDSHSDVTVLDVRTPEEFAEGHIPNAINLPVSDVEAKAVEMLPNKNQTILVYCRSGNRSKTASELLANAGYSHVYEFGGINSWPYDIEK